MTLAGDPDAPNSSMNSDLNRLTESFIRFSVRIDEQYKAIVVGLDKLDARFGEIEKANGEHERQITRNTQRLETITECVDELDAHARTTDAKLGEMQPWVSGLRWALTIAGGLLVVAIVGAVLWAISTSGVGLP